MKRTERDKQMNYTSVSNINSGTKRLTLFKRSKKICQGWSRLLVHIIMSGAVAGVAMGAIRARFIV